MTPSTADNRSLFQRLRADEEAAWEAYVNHPFVVAMGEGTLPKAAFQRYLEQDYLFLIHFARAYALAGYKAQALADLNDASAGLDAILSEMDLHVRLCARWGVTQQALEALEEAAECVAYTRFVLDAGLSGDLLDLHGALSPCVIGYGEIGARLATSCGPLEAHPYADWIGEYAGAPYQAVAAAAIDRLDRLSAGEMTAARYARLCKLFRSAALLERDFWQMGFRLAGLS